MDALLNNWVAGPLAEAGMRQLMGVALDGFYTFTLVVMRIAGLLSVGPFFGQAVIPMNVRALLVLAISFVVTPALATHARIGARNFDVNEDGRLSRDEVPEQLVPRFDRLLATHHFPPDATLTYDQFFLHVDIPPTVLDYLLVVIREFALGVVLGLGMLTVLSGLQLAGQMIDQQTGTALGEVLNPELNITGSQTSQTLYLIGLMAFFTLEPVRGHLLMLSALLDTFQVMPAGAAFISESSVFLLRDLVTQSLVLAIQVAAPLLATISLVELAMGFLGHSVPQVNVLVLGFGVRAIVGLLILALTVTGATAAITSAIPATIDQLARVLVP